jgi:VIT1/CCC1 family predicted Fe2+/Mn2+ transporter
VSFAIGAFFPLLPYLLGAHSVLASSIVSLCALFTAGAISSRFTARSWTFAGARQLLIGAVAAAITYGIGSLFHSGVS